jgi:hypothetical protein
VGRRRGGRWCAGTASPDQHGVVLVHGEPEHLDDFGFQIVEVGVIEMKLTLEGTIRHPAPVLEHVESAIQHLLKGHRPPSRCRCGVQKPAWKLAKPCGRSYTAHG